MFGSGAAQEGTTGHHQIGTSIIQGIIHDKVFLFPAECCRYFGHILIEQLRYRHSGLVEKRLRAEQRELVILRFTAIGNKDSRDTQRFTFTDSHNKGRTAGIPYSIAARLESTAHATGRE